MGVEYYACSVCEEAIYEEYISGCAGYRCRKRICKWCLETKWTRISPAAMEKRQAKADKAALRRQQEHDHQKAVIRAEIDGTAPPAALPEEEEEKEDEEEDKAKDDKKGEDEDEEEELYCPDCAEPAPSVPLHTPGFRIATDREVLDYVLAKFHANEDLMREEMHRAVFLAEIAKDKARESQKAQVDQKQEAPAAAAAGAAAAEPSVGEKRARSDEAGSE